MNAGSQLATMSPSHPPPVGDRVTRDERWLRAARRARMLSWISLAWMTVEGGAGVAVGVAAGSIALVGWGLASGIEGLASVIVIWRFTGSRTLSETSERRAQRAVAISFFLLAPYIAVEAIRTLATSGRPEATVLGIALTASSVLLMPLLGRAKQRLGERLGSSATAGEGTQNVLCAMQAAAVLAGLAANAAFRAWWLDPLIALFIAYVAISEGREAWAGHGCDACSSPLAAIAQRSPLDGDSRHDDSCCS